MNNPIFKKNGYSVIKTARDGWCITYLDPDTLKEEIIADGYEDKLEAVRDIPNE